MKMNIIKAATLLTLVSGLALTFSPGESYADPKRGDIKSFPAAMCQTAPGGKGIAMYGSNGEVYNRHPREELAVYCPLVRDVMASTLGVHSVQVSFEDRHPIDPRCFLALTDTVTGLRQTFRLHERKYSSILTYRRPLSVTVGKELTSYSVVCLLPPKNGSLVSRLKSISYREYK